MTKTADQLTICRHCGSDACYEYRDSRHVRWQCMDCGFYTNTYMLKGSTLVAQMIKELPELFTAISSFDDDGFYWAPMFVNKPGIGIITPMGNSADNWTWAFIPEVEIPFEERHRFPIKGESGKFHTHRTDMSQMQQFGQKDYILALQAANLLNVT